MSFDCILGGPIKRFDPQVLLDPFEEQLHLPAAFVQLRNHDGEEGELVGEEDEALRHKLPHTLVQRYQVHRLRNILNKLLHVTRPTIKKLICKAFTAASYQQGLASARAIIAQYKETFSEAMKCFERDLEECLTVLKFPFAHRAKLRTTNLLERLFGEGKRRTKIIPRFTSESSGLALVFAVLVDACEGWRGVRMSEYLTARLQQMTEHPDSAWEDPDLIKLAA